MIRLRPLTLVVALTAVISGASLPAQIYKGDPTTSAEEASQLVLHGHFWSPEEKVRHMQSPADEGQYFVKNERNGHFYSKYGLGSTLLLVPPVVMYKLATLASKHPSVGKHAWLAAFNLYYLALTCLFAALLYRVSRRVTDSDGVAITYVLTVLYCTFVYNYTRGQSMELPQLILTTALLEVGQLLVQASERSEAPERPGCTGYKEPSKRLALWFVLWIAFALLVLIKAFYLVLAPLLLCFVARERTRKALALEFAAPVAAIIAMLAVVFTLRNGAPWLTGYHQWHPEYVSFGGRWADGVWGFLFDPQKSAFLYFPLLLVALPGLRSFARTHRRELVFAWGALFSALLIIGKMPSWRGDVSYGPRYLLFALPIAALPAITVMDWTRGKLRARQQVLPAASTATAIAALLLASLWWQLEFNRYPFFTYWDLWVSIPDRKRPEIDHYFKHSLPQLVLREARAAAFEGADWAVLNPLNPADREQALVITRAKLGQRSYWAW